MLVTVTVTGPEAPVLGFLLHKHPDRVQTFDLAVGTATVFYPVSEAERVTAALLVEVDPVGMVKRGLKSREGLSLAEYVTDRPYAASSMLSVAIGRVFKTALNGRCDARPEAAASPLPIEIRVPAVPASSGQGDRGATVRRLFGPLGWDVVASETGYGPEGSWGPAPYVDLTLTGVVRLADALSHLYVLLPVLDDAKHYWVSSDEVDKLVRRGEGWLATHPDRDWIVRRYLAARRSYVEDATARLQALDDSLPDGAPDDDADDPASEGTEAHPGGVPDERGLDASEQAAVTPEARPTPLKVHRLDAVLAALREVGARRVVDMGCGEGVYLRKLVADPRIDEVVGIDVSARELERAERRLGLDRLPDRQRDKLILRQSSVTYRDDQIAGFDAILLVEVVEHLDPDRIAALESTVFGAARPSHVIATTPNREYNRRYGLTDDQRRHPDHRFEWTRAAFDSWATRVADEHGYGVEFRPVGVADPDVGPPTQLALFRATPTAKEERG